MDGIASVKFWNSQRFQDIKPKKTQYRNDFDYVTFIYSISFCIFKLLFSHWFILHSTPGEYIRVVIRCSQLRQLRLKEAERFVQEHNRGRVTDYTSIQSRVHSAPTLGRHHGLAYRGEDSCRAPALQELARSA